MQDQYSIGNFLASKDHKGNWIYKAKEIVPIAKKKEAKYRERPQFKLQEEIEGNAKTKFKLVTNNTVLKIVKFIK